jgi:hypothetical protein
MIQLNLVPGWQSISGQPFVEHCQNPPATVFTLPDLRRLNIILKWDKQVLKEQKENDVFRPEGAT